MLPMAPPSPTSWRCLQVQIAVILKTLFERMWLHGVETLLNIAQQLHFVAAELPAGRLLSAAVANLTPQLQPLFPGFIMPYHSMLLWRRQRAS